MEKLFLTLQLIWRGDLALFICILIWPCFGSDDLNTSPAIESIPASSRSQELPDWITNGSHQSSTSPTYAEKHSFLDSESVLDANWNRVNNFIDQQNNMGNMDYSDTNTSYGFRRDMDAVQREIEIAKEYSPYFQRTRESRKYGAMPGYIPTGLIRMPTLLQKAKQGAERENEIARRKRIRQKPAAKYLLTKPGIIVISPDIYVTENGKRVRYHVEYPVPHPTNKPVAVTPVHKNYSPPEGAGP